MPGFVFSSVLFACVVWLFWWLVDVTGGVACQAFTVARSIHSGIASWATPWHDGERGNAPAVSRAAESAAFGRAGDPAGEDEMTVEPIAVRRDRRSLR